MRVSSDSAPEYSAAPNPRLHEGFRLHIYELLNYSLQVCRYVITDINRVRSWEMQSPRLTSGEPIVRESLQAFCISLAEH